MVRLKESWLFWITDKIFLSIPYGAIKSNNVLEQIDALTNFQFLMVRLKETMCCKTSIV